MFNTEIYPSTFVYILIFIILIAIASVQLWYGRKKKDRGYYIKYLILMVSGLIYNTVEGLLPDPNFNINIMAQNILAWTTGVIIAFHYLGFLKNEYGLVFLKKISFEFIGISILFMLIILFILPYIITQSLETSRHIFLSFSLAFLLLCLFIVFKQQFKKFEEHTNILFKIHDVNGFLGFLGLVSLPVSILLFGDNQVIEQTCFSFGFFIVSFDFFLYPKRKEEIKKNISFDKLSAREAEILKMLLNAPNLKYSEISSQLNISEKALSSHLSSIYKKTGLKSKKEIEELSKSFRDILST